jgi:hypothetical protein
MAMNKQLDLYLRLERIMMELDEQEDPLADRIRDLMDPLWYGLSDEDHQFIDGRGVMEIRVLYPITLMVPDLFGTAVAEKAVAIEIHPENGVGKHFALAEDLWAA